MVSALKPKWKYSISHSANPPCKAAILPGLRTPCSCEGSGKVVLLTRSSALWNTFLLIPGILGWRNPDFRADGGSDISELNDDCLNDW